MNLVCCVSAQTYSEKCAPGLRERAFETGKTVYTLVVRDVEAFKQKNGHRAGFRILKEYAAANILCVEVEPAFVFEQLLPDPQVVFVDRTARKAGVELPVPGHNLLIDKIALAHALFPQYDGRGQTVSIKEDLFDTTDVDFKNRVLRSSNGSNRIRTHATIMATQIGGAGNSSPAGLGAAPGCRFTGSDFLFLLPDDNALYEREQVSVQNHSYGAETDNFYGPDALAFDRSVQLRPTLLHVFSAGNRGATPLKTGLYANLSGFANLSGSFKMAKNVLLAGALDSFGRVVPYSSRGPAYDGRIKPELTAYGQDGSSGSAALVSGTALLLQQAYAGRHGGQLPDAALLRAVLVNTADDSGAPGPDYFGGFGRLNAARAVELLDAGRYFSDRCAPGAARSFTFEVGPGNRQLDATLAWNDPPGAPGAAKALINDLDLTLTDPAGNIWRPWVLSAVAQSDSLNLPARRGVDTLNNLERLRVDTPPAGRYTLEVRGSRVRSGGEQPFSVAWQTLKNKNFRWVAPLRTRGFRAGVSNVLMWESDPGLAKGRLEYKTGDPSDWISLDTALDLRAGFRRWTAPDVFAEARFRVLIDKDTFLSDTFLISGPLRLQTGFNCPDSVLMFWNPAGPTARYKISALGEQSFAPWRIQNDTFFVLKKKDLPATRFSVAVRSANGLEGPHSPADYTVQGAGCYIRTFLADRTPGGQVDLHLSLGSTYQLARVGFEKLENGRFRELGSEAVQTQTLEYQFADERPAEGANFYRARIETKEKGVAYSDTAQVWFAGTGSLLAFPNPLAGNGTLSVLNGAEDAVEIFMYNALGQLVFQQKAEGYLVDFVLPYLPAGAYPYVIKNGKRSWTGRLAMGR